MKQAPLNVLFLPAWYPDAADPMLGLFIQRHAGALAGKAEVAVIYVRQSDETRKPSFQLQVEQGVLVCRVVYPAVDGRARPLADVRKAARYLASFRRGLKALKASGFTPDICHVHVLTRAGIPALWLRTFKGTPYVITEHWSRYRPGGTYGGWLRGMLTRLVVRRASVLSTVTHDLAVSMASHRIVNSDIRVLPNVVDTDLFRPREEQNTSGLKHLVHISVFEDRSKNVSGMLRCLAELAGKRDDFRVSMVGEGIDLGRMKELSSALGLDDVVTFSGLLQGKALADTLASADLLLLFSHYENMPVVINEAFSCGVPVLSTDVGGIREYLRPGTGRLVPPGDERSFLEALNGFLDGDWDTDPDTMRNYALEHFSVDAVATQLMRMYTDTLSR